MNLSEANGMKVQISDKRFSLNTIIQETTYYYGKPLVKMSILNRGYILYIRLEK